MQARRVTIKKRCELILYKLEREGQTAIAGKEQSIVQRKVGSQMVDGEN
jgi:predicted transcriptional regulator YheO